MQISCCNVCLVFQDFTGVPAVADLACMRDAMNNLGGDSDKINPLVRLVTCIKFFITFATSSILIGICIRFRFQWILSLIIQFKLMLLGQKTQYKQIWNLNFKETRRDLLF